MEVNVCTTILTLIKIPGLTLTHLTVVFGLEKIYLLALSTNTLSSK